MAQNTSPLEIAMKRLTALLLIALLALCASTLLGCATDPQRAAAANADDYNLVASWDESSHTLSLAETVRLTNRAQNAVTEVKFHIYANQYREDAQTSVVPNVYKSAAYPNGDSFGKITFDQVKVDGTPVAFVIEGTDNDILSVPLGKELFGGESVTVQMDCEIVIANVKHRLGYTDATINLGNFYPVLCDVDGGNYVCTPYCNVGDPFVSEVANYDVTMIVPKGYVAASSGVLVEATSDNTVDTLKFSASAVRDFALVASKNFKKLTTDADGVQVNYYYYADKDAENTLKLACDTLKYFSSKISEYPYAQYSVCETEFCYGGMEYPCLSMVTSGSSSYREAVIHETAHQWFYGIVGNDQFNDAWMDEGLAEFLTMQYLDERGEKPLADGIRAKTKTYTTYVDVLNRYYDRADTSYKCLADYKNDSEYVILTYVKGSLMFNTLYETMGKEKFFRALKNYYAAACYTIASPQTMALHFEQVGGKGLQNVFAAFADGKEIIGEITD